MEKYTAGTEENRLKGKIIANHIKLGSIGEDAAAEELELRGYEIIIRNFSCKLGELDIVAKPRGKNLICFVEVKSRRSSRYGTPAEAVSPVKQRRIRRLATYFLLKEWDLIGADACTDFRFDVIEVTFEGDTPIVNIIEGAFS